jgi:hypothetical protein
VDYSKFTIEYKTTIKSLPVIKSEYQIEKGDTIELNHDTQGVVMFYVESIVNNVLELEEYHPILVTV